MSNTTGSLTPQQIAAIESALRGNGGGTPSGLGPTSATATTPSSAQSVFDDTYGVSKALAQAGLVAMMPGQGGVLQGMPTANVGDALQWLNQVPASQGPEGVYAIQVALFRAGLLSKIVEPGVIDTATETAFKDLLQHSAAGQVDPQAYLNMADTQGQYGLVDSALRSWITSLQGDIAKTKSEHFSITDAPDIANSFIKAYENVLGIGPTQDQIDQFVKEYQGQERSKEANVYGAERQQYRTDLKYAQSAMSALGSTGINGVEDFVNAYKNVMAKNVSSIGAAAVLGNIPKNGQTASGLQGLPHNLNYQTSGGVYGISLPVWQQAQGLFKGLGQYKTPGSAPPQLQENVLHWMSAYLYHEYGNWQDVAAMLVEGQPMSGAAGAAADKQLGVNNLGSNVPTVSGFVSQIIAQINAQMQKAENFLANGAPTVSTTVTMPNANAEAINYAQKADPLRADAQAVVNNYGYLIGRMFRPGGLVDVAPQDPTTGVGMVGIGTPTAAQAAAATGGM